MRKNGTLPWIAKHDIIRAEAIKAWKWLRRLPQYKNDYKLYHSETNPEVQSRLKAKWLIWPLIDPADKNCRSAFVAALGEKFGHHPYRPGVSIKDKNLSMAVHAHLYKDSPTLTDWTNKFPLPLLPKKIDFEIDPTKPITFLLSQIGEKLEQIQKVYGINPKRPQFSDVSRKYRKYVSVQLGKTKPEILSTVFPESTGLKDEERASYRKKLARMRPT